MGLVSGLSKNPDLTIPLKIGKGYFNGHLITNGLYQIADGIEGHIVYLEENDSAAIHLSTRNDMKANLAAHIYMKYFHTLTATGKYAWHYMFFDYLTAKTERMIFGIKGDRVVNNDSTSMLFKKDCDYALQIGNRLVDSLYKKDLVSLNFKKVIKEELNAIYVSNLCTYLSSIRKKKINPLYFAS